MTDFGKAKMAEANFPIALYKEGQSKSNQQEKKNPKLTIYYMTSHELVSTINTEVKPCHSLKLE